jgi:SAM-dependent methyltransferase
VSKAVWCAALGEETSFWEQYLSTRGSLWPDEFSDRLDPDLPLQEELLPYISHIRAGGKVRILDCGAGPLTILGKRLDDREVELVAVDALADEYDRLLATYQVVPLVRTLHCEVEELEAMFGPDEFDLVYMRNALDHSYDPVRGIRQMLRVAKPGCSVFLDHRVDEALHGRYRGLHQWNFRLEDDAGFVIWNRDARFVVQEEIPDAKVGPAEVSARWGDDWITVVVSN